MDFKNTYDFNYMANELLNKRQLCVFGKKYRMCEIEFYLKSEDHNDEYTHCSAEQFNYGYWYFHKYKTGTFKSGTFKGLDITLGKDNYYGILIRSVYDIENKRLIEGPCNSVNEFLKVFKCNDVKELHEQYTEIINPIKENKLLTLEIADFSDKIKVGPRIGLSDKYPEFKEKPYRFVVMDVKKEKKKLHYIN